MKCKNCGNEIQENDEFCGICGTKVKTNEPIKIKFTYLIIGILILFLVIPIGTMIYNNKQKPIENSTNYDKANNQIQDDITIGKETTENITKNYTNFKGNIEELKNVFDQTLFASSDKEARPILTGLNVKCANNTLEFVATDTYRLSKKIIELSTSNEFNVTIPKSSLDELNKIIELGTMVQVYITEKKVIFDLEDCVVISRLISGTYPDTSRLIPNAFDQTLTLSTKDLLGAVDRASILLTERNNVVKLNMKDDEVFVSAKSMEVGYVVEKLNDYYYEGNPLMISFSARFLVEAVRALNSEEITLHFTGDMKPIILKSKTNPNLIELILPVRTYN